MPTAYRIDKNTQQVFVTAGYMTESLGHYLAPDWKLHSVPSSGVAHKRVNLGLEYLDRYVPKGDQYWLVYTRPFHGDPDGQLLATLLRRKAVRELAVFPGAVVYRGLPSRTFHFDPLDPES